VNRVDEYPVVPQAVLRRYVESELDRRSGADKSDYHLGAMVALTHLKGKFLLTPDEEFEVGKTRREMMGHD